MKIKYIYNPDYATTGSAGSLYCIKDAIKNDDIILLEGDLLYDKKALKEIFGTSDKNVILTIVAGEFSGFDKQITLNRKEGKKDVQKDRGLYSDDFGCLFGLLVCRRFQFQAEP